MTPEDLARELGISPKALRQWLRDTYPRSDAQQNQPWILTEEQVAAARERFAAPTETEAPGPWDEFVGWASEFISRPDYDTHERNYKLEIADQLRAARENVRRDDEGWPGTLKRAFGAPNNLTYFITHSKYLDWAQADPEEARAGLLAIWDEDSTVQDRLAAFFARLPTDVLSGVGNRLQIASFLLLADPTQFVVYRPTPFKKAVACVGFEEFPDDSEVAVYSHALSFVDEVLDEAAARGLQLRDRLDAQSLIWTITKVSPKEAGLSPDDTEALLRFRGDLPKVWWVNQGGSFNAEMEAGVVTAPFRNKAGHDLQHWKNLELLRPGDVIVHYVGGELKALSEVAHKWAPGSPLWDEQAEGRVVRTRYHLIDVPIPLEEILADWRTAESGPFTRQGAVKQVYLEPLSVPFSDWLRDAFQERWPDESPWAPRQRTTWLFQSNPKTWDLQANLAHMEPGDEDTWTVSRYKAEIAEGDRVLLWQAGPDAGLYAVGQLVGELFERDEEESYGSGDSTTAISYRLTDRIDPPILRSALVEHPILKGLQVITAPQGSNFRVTDEQWTEIKKLLEGGAIVPPPSLGPPERSFHDISLYIANQGLILSERTLRRFHVSLATRGFVVLSGVSGTGKTWLTEVYAEAIGARYLLVPVAPNWTTNEDLLGYLNPLDDAYHHTVFSQFLQEAAAEYTAATEAQRKPQQFILTLDEMNLARVEYYFAKFLSAMEVRSRRGTASIELAPNQTVELTPNLLFVGTVNVDETTHGFADKVFDRAQLIELEAPRDAMADHIGQAAFRDTLLNVYDAVAPTKPFAFRVVDEIKAYVGESEALDVAWHAAVDEQILQKVLPKLTGADPAVRFALEALLAMADDKGLELTGRKAKRMLDDYDRDGFTSYF